MSEKTLAGIGRDAFWKPLDGSESEILRWQVAADAIAAPLLARIAELEGERDRAKCALENSKAAHKSLADDAMRALAGKVCTPEEGYVKATHCLRGDIGALEQAAYQRGVCEGMERAARITEDSHIAHSKGCECRECVPLSDAAECIRDAIRSASPAVDVTSDKGGER